MPSPRVFISSTYVDLADARSVVEHYFHELFFETVTMERGGIYYDHTKPLDLSCYETVKDCDLMILIIGGIYGSPESHENVSGRNKTYNSCSKREYLEALSAGIPIFTFIKQSVHNEYHTYINQSPDYRKKFKPNFVDNIQIFQLIKEIRELKTNNLIIEYDNVSEILQYLKKSTAGLVHNAIKHGKSEKDKSSIFINGYKLYYFRRKNRVSHTELSKSTSIARNFLTSLENVRNPKAEKKHGQIFRQCSIEDLSKIEQALSCQGHLEVGKRNDDLLSVYIQYYHSNRGKSTKKRKTINHIYDHQAMFPTKCVVFDFDGTLTYQNDRTTWELIWDDLGYSIEDCSRLHRDFINKVISHWEWCEKTCKAFNDKNISERTLIKVASQTKLMKGVPELIEILANHNIELHILSGSIMRIILSVLGPLAGSFTHIQANELKFTGSILSYIQGTDYDFEGKADYVNNLLKRKNFSTTEVLFVGNSNNDLWVSRSGITTLCVNPHFTDGNDEKEWLYCIREMHDGREILKYINLGN